MYRSPLLDADPLQDSSGFFPQWLFWVLLQYMYMEPMLATTRFLDTHHILVSHTGECESWWLSGWSASPVSSWRSRFWIPFKAYTCTCVWFRPRMHVCVFRLRNGGGPENKNFDYVQNVLTVSLVPNGGRAWERGCWQWWWCLYLPCVPWYLPTRCIQCPEWQLQIAFRTSHCIQFAIVYIYVRNGSSDKEEAHL